MNSNWLVPALLVLLVIAVISVRWVASLDEDNLPGRFGAPLLFGAWLLLFWQLLTQAFEVPRVLLPAPSHIWEALLKSYDTLADRKSVV